MIFTLLPDLNTAEFHSQEFKISKLYEHFLSLKIKNQFGGGQEIVEQIVNTVMVT